MTSPALALNVVMSGPDLAALLDAIGNPSLLSPRAAIGASSPQQPAVSAEMQAAARLLTA